MMEDGETLEALLASLSDQSLEALAELPAKDQWTTELRQRASAQLAARRARVPLVLDRRLGAHEETGS